MAIAAKLKLRVVADVTEEDTAGGVRGASTLLRHLLEVGETTYANGTGADQVNRVWSVTGSYTTTPTDYDLKGGLTDLSGGVINLAELVAVVVVNNSTTAGENIQIGGDTNSVPIFGAVADYITIGPGGVFVWASPTDGVTVTSSTGDILQIAASTGTISADVLIVGRTA